MATTKEAKFKAPKTLGAAVDLLYTTKQDRLALEKKVTELKAQETALKEHLINTLPKDDATGAAGKLARATISVKRVPQVKNWDLFYAYVLKKKAFHLMQRRLADAAVTELWEAGKEVPGVEPFNVPSVSLNKL